MFGALWGGIAAAPVEGDMAHLEPRPQSHSINIELSIHIDRHWQNKNIMQVHFESLLKKIHF